jgi:hypothetical protein
MRCERCGTTLPANSKFCLGCGQAVQPTRTIITPPPAYYPPPVSAPSADRRRAMLTAVAGLLVLALLLGGFAIVLARRARGGAGVAQLPPGPGGDDFHLLPSPRPGASGPLFGGRPPAPNAPASGGTAPGSSVTGAAPPPNAGAPVTAVPGPGAPGGPPVVASPPGSAGGPSVLAGPQGQAGGPPLLRGPQPRPGGPPLLRGPQGPPAGPSVVSGPQATAPNAPPVVAGPQSAPNGPPVVASPPTARTPPPQEPPMEDVSGYLARLGRVEQMRLQLEARLLTAVTNSTFQNALRAYTSAGTGEEDAQQGQVLRQTARDFEIVAREFTALNIQFRRFTPPVPVSCRRLHADYAIALSNTPSFVRGLGNALLRMDLGAVNMVQQLGQGTIDRGFRAADLELQRVCDSHKISKPYDLGSSSRSSLLGP